MSTYYTIMSMIDGFKSFINLAVMVLTIVASWIMYAKAGEHGWAAIVPVVDLPQTAEGAVEDRLGIGI